MKVTQSTLWLPILGMHCPHCASQVEAALKKLAGVTSVEVQLELKRAKLTYDPSWVDLLNIQAAITEAGYAVPAQAVALQVMGMSCVSCVARVEGALQDVLGVIHVEVRLSPGSAKVEYIPDVVTFTQMEQAVREAGYTARVMGAGHEPAAANESGDGANGREKPAHSEGWFRWIKKAIARPGTLRN